MAGRRYKEKSTAFIHPQASTRVPDGDKAAQLPDQQIATTSVHVYGKATFAKICASLLDV